MSQSFSFTSVRFQICHLMSQHLKVCYTFISQSFFTHCLHQLTQLLKRWPVPNGVVLHCFILISGPPISSKGFTPLWYISVDGGWCECGPWRNMTNYWTTSHIHLHQSTSEVSWGKPRKKTHTHTHTHRVIVNKLHCKKKWLVGW